MKIIDEIKAELAEFVRYERGEALRNELLDLANKHYTPEYTQGQHLAFLSNQADYISVKRVHPQNTNYPHVYVLFTEKSQHVYGDCLAECIDRAIDASPDRKGVN